ncbi:hypothetical protein D9M68_223490 [compost metagenome]
MYRVRRMYLVNAGTNKNKPSRRIADVDPRDGAAVVGPNGVGKTTTLRLNPLFYGHLPSQIIQAGHGQKSMPRFVFPTPESAVVFEYQRGPSESTDLRLAVLRARRDNPDALEYRLYESAFNRDLFVDGAGNFMDDAGSIAAAANFGVNFTPKLTTSEYRSIILNLRGNTKDSQKLRLLAREYSFTPKAMPNLDRLVAAVVKEHVSFSDLIQVAVGMVNEEIGSASTTDRNKLLLKQTKSDITDWIKNRRACEESHKLSPSVDELERCIDRYYGEENDIRLLSCEVSALLNHKSDMLRDATARRDEADEQRRRTEAEEQLAHERLSSSLETTQTSRRKAEQDFRDQESMKKRFDDGKVEHWSKQQENASLLKAERTNIMHQRNIYAAETASIDAEINAAKEQVTIARDASLEAIDTEWKAAVERRNVQIDSLNTQLKDASQSARERHTEQASKAEAAIRASDVALTRARALSERIEGPADLCEVVSTLRDEVDALNDEVSQARRTEVERSREHAAACRAFDDLDREVDAAQGQVAGIKEQIASLERSLEPEEGTVHAALRQHPYEDWENLAKLISPTHLTRTDLSPNFDATKDALTAFGWSIDLDKIAVPSWANEEDTRAEILDTQQRLEVTQRHFDELKSKRDTTSARVTSAHNQLLLAQSQVSLVEKNRTTKSQSLDRAKLALEQAKKEERERFDADVKRLSKELSDLEAGRAVQSKAAKDELSKIEIRFDKQLWDADIAAKKETTDFEDKRLAIKEQAQVHLRDLDAQRRQRLREKDLDPAKIDAWDTRRRKIDSELRQIEDNATFVDQWRDWLKANGPAELIRLEGEFQAAESALSAASGALKEHEAQAMRAAEIHRVQQATLEKQITDIAEQCRKLQALADELPAPMRTDVSFDANMPSSQLINNVDSARSKLAATNRRIGELHQTVYNRLTAGENNVKEFVEKSVSEATERIDKAHALVKCHRNIPSEIVSNLNNTLRVILDTIERFHGAIQSFETEIKRFNRELGKGLRSVQPFERIKDLEIEMVTDFSDLGFMERLKKVSQFAKETHFTLGRAGQRREVPDVGAEIVLQEFANTIATGGRLEVDLASHIRIRGKVMENGVEKSFQRESELENVSSNGLTSIILITLLIGMLNMIRGSDQVYVTWVTDEVGKFDGPNFIALMDMLRDNRIDVITASPDLNPRHYRKFAQRYRLEDMGVIRMFAPPKLPAAIEEGVLANASGEVL